MYFKDRMPPQIGDFISDQVYDGQLQSNPDHLIGHSLASCYFVDVEGCEKHYEKSWVVCKINCFQFQLS